MRSTWCFLILLRLNSMTVQGGINFLKQTSWPLFINGVQLPQDYSHFEEAV